eukprot:jgi/Chlat1/4925/Chrsp31S04843
MAEEGSTAQVEAAGENDTLAVNRTGGDSDSGSNGRKLAPSKHQVAGHQQSEGKNGALADNQGHFYKPLQNASRGDREQAFYERLERLKREDEGGGARVGASENALPDSVRAFIPRYYGSVDLPPELQPDNCSRHLELEDLTHPFEHPSIVDLKIGYRTWYVSAGEDYIARHKRKDAQTTTATLGFKVSGMQVWLADEQEMWRASRQFGKDLRPSGMVSALCNFFVGRRGDSNDDAGPHAHTPPDLAATSAQSSLRRGADAVTEAIAKLEELQSWFKTQTMFHFSSSSVLILLEGESPSPSPSSQQHSPSPSSSSSPPRVSVRLVDFAHVTCEAGSLDDNFMSGLASLLSTLREVRTRLVEAAG